MRAVVQRVSRARVRVEGETVGQIDAGLLVLVGVQEGDGERDRAWMARKLVGLRIFPEFDNLESERPASGGKMTCSVTDVGGALLVVSQFTLCADVRRGARPSFVGAMAPREAAGEFEALVALLREQVPVETGRFGAQMEVESINDGPVTLWLDSREST